ncbi:MAG: DUF378 domain-containing protein [Patescibacteria group bacterium]
MMGHPKMCAGHMAAYWLMWVGAVNWGLIGAFNFNLVNTILGSVPTVERIVYVVVGLSALFMLAKSMCKGCKTCCGGADKGGCKGGSCSSHGAGPATGNT